MLLNRNIVVGFIIVAFVVSTWTIASLSPFKEKSTSIAIHSSLVEAPLFSSEWWDDVAPLVLSSPVEAALLQQKLIRQIVDHQFRRFHAIGITRAMLDNSWKSDPQRGTRMFHVQVIDNTIYLVNFQSAITGNKHLEFAHGAHHVHLIQEALKLGPLPDIEFMSDLGDNPRLPVRDNKFYAGFHPVHCDTDFAMSFPYHLFSLRPFDTLEDECASIRKGSKAHPWQTKKDRAVWRGGYRGPVPQSNRDILVEKFGKEHTDYIDAHYSDAAHYISMSDQQSFKYQVYVEGRTKGPWADRLKYLACGNSVLLVQTTGCAEWYGLSLQPWVHYVPVHQNFSDFIEAIDYLRSHDDEAQKIAQRASTWSELMVNRATTIQYVRELLLEWHRHQRFKVTRHPDAFQVKDIKSMFVRYYPEMIQRLHAKNLTTFEDWNQESDAIAVILEPE